MSITPRRRESPMRRKLPDGKVVWLARYTAPDGSRAYWKPEWNRKSSTFKRKRDAQAAIDEAYARVYGIGAGETTIGSYFETWLDRHPRSERTNETNRGRIKAVLEVAISGKPLRNWPLAELRRRHALELVNAMLTDQGRATTGALGILRALSAMAEDAITDEQAELNPFKGVKVRHNDPRARKSRKPIRVWSFEEMHSFADAAGQVPAISQDRTPGQQREAIRAAQARRAMVRILSDCGLRLGEMLALSYADYDGQSIDVAGTAHKGRIIEGDTKEKRHVRTVPVPQSLAEILDALSRRLDTNLLFATRTGSTWWRSNFYRNVWAPTKMRAGIDPTPHEFRHSWVTHMRAAGIDDADLAAVAGHTVETMLSRYTHSLGRSDDAIRGVIG